ncbi:hypothetical protein [Thalassotalea atypica]|uniref:hypothetical protein n=1 Tax=Thalassotalea atypica TaxID=2054316 RepID=UPI00257433C0|nr:hypothetical protein [Thalassotalea atypica]
MDFKLKQFALCAAIALQGCGGGGGSSDTNTPIVTDPDSLEILVNEQTVLRKQSTDLLLYFPQQTVSDIKWQQVSGPNVELFAANSKVISFVPDVAGDYSFQASFNLNGQNQNLTKTITVNEEENQITARLGHAVVEQNKVSLRVELADDIDLDSVSWTQLSGPSLSFSDSDDPAVVYFNAPSVESDQIIEFDVSARDNGDNTYSDKISVLIEDKPTIQSNAYFDDALAKVAPFNSNSKYADVIVDCVYSNTLTSSCQLDRLPLIAQDTLSPTVEDIMDRVVVSHPWMGDRFRDFIEQQDPHGDFKRLLRATTAIVISYDIRPAFYWAATGAIYLDPEFLWLTPSERDTINEAPDYRSGFGEELQFEMIWRYVKNNDYASANYPWDVRVERSSADTLYDLGYLLYHELAHANDFFPSSRWSSLSTSKRILDEAVEHSTQSDILDVTHPLASQIMKDLAQVRYAGEDATTQQKSYLPVDIELLFEPDGAVYFYSYRSIREDFAMLFEELMMQSRYGISRDIAITNNPASGASSQDFIVHWGQRGRIEESQIYDRVLFATERILPEFDAHTALQNLPQVMPLRQGDDWLANLTLNQRSMFSLAKQMLQQQDNNIQHSRRQHQYYIKPLPSH